MKNKYLLLLVILFSSFFQFSVFAQQGQWVWLHGTGNNTYNSPGNMGVQGVPSPTNDPPALYETCEWTDLNGKFWMYGGLDDNAGVKVHNDLWMYDPVDSEWTWVNGTNALNDSGNYGMQGVASPANRPPSLGYGVTTWADLNGNLWMFGGAQTQNGPFYADLWEYNISGNVWTWVKGPGITNSLGIYGTEGVSDTANYPPSRAECAASWVDAAGNLWLFGGQYTGFFNDLWRYNIASNSWTWMKGSNLLTQKGFWGKIGVEDAANVPSSRRAYCHWVDNSGNFWMYGGYGLDSSGVISGYYLSDLWRYNPSANNWTWMNGSALDNTTGVFGTKCMASAANKPPPRYENRACWTDANGNFWMFGGYYSSSPFNSFGLNDLWMYCVTANEWTWVSGSNTTSGTGSWGTIDVPSPTNVPSPRIGCPGWTDKKGHLYMFGGTAATSFGSLYNDLWQFTIDSACGSPCASIISAPPPVASFQSSDTVFCSGNCINFTDLSTNNPTSWQWSFQGAFPSSSSAQNPQSICYISQGAYNVTLVATNLAGSDTIALSQFINVYNSPPTPVITCSNDSLLCSFDTSYASYQWYSDSILIQGATSPYYVISHNGNYNLAVKNKNGCSIAVGITTTGCLTGVINLPDDHSVFLYPNPTTDQLFVSGYPLIAKSIITVFNVLGETIYKEEVNSKQEIINCKTFSSGVYFVQIANETGRWGGRFVKE